MELFSNSTLYLSWIAAHFMIILMDQTHKNHKMIIRDCKAEVLKFPISYVQADVELYIGYMGLSNFMLNHHWWAFWEGLFLMLTSKRFKVFEYRSVLISRPGSSTISILQERIVYIKQRLFVFHTRILCMFTRFVSVHLFIWTPDITIVQKEKSNIFCAKLYICVKYAFWDLYIPAIMKRGIYLSQQCF